MRENAVKNTGIARNIDDMGRIVIPVEFRKRLGVDKQDALYIFFEENQIVLRKLEAVCIACGSDERLVRVGKKDIFFCGDCRDEMNAMNKP